MTTPSQDRILNFLREWQGTHPYPPTLREVMAGCGITTTSTISYQVRQLREMGLVTFEPGENRTLVLAGSKYSVPEEVGS